MTKLLNSAHKEHTCCRFVAYFDIMGFKDTIYRNGHNSVANYFEVIDSSIKSLQEIVETAKAASNINDGLKAALKAPIYTAVFSDSILFYSDNVSAPSSIHMMLQAGHFLELCLQSAIPIKGALACGTFTAIKERSIYYGMPLIDAYLLSEDTAYYGVPIHHTAEAQLPNILPRFAKHGRLKWTNIPLKSCKEAKHLILTPSGIADPEDEDYHRLIKGFKTFYENSSGKIRKYLYNTLDVYGIDLPHKHNIV